MKKPNFLMCAITFLFASSLMAQQFTNNKSKEVRINL